MKKMKSDNRKRKHYYYALIMGIIILSSCSGKTTKYCPLSHKLEDLASCSLLYESSEYTMIQHAEFDSNIYYIEIIRDRQSKFYELPELLTQLAPQGYSASVIQFPELIVEFFIKGIGKEEIELVEYNGPFF